MRDGLAFELLLRNRVDTEFCGFVITLAGSNRDSAKVAYCDSPQVFE